MTNPWPIAPLPGVSRQQLYDSLRKIHDEAFNIRGGAYGSGPGQLARYLNWASTAARTLANQIKAADIDRLFLTPGHGRLLGLAGVGAAPTHPIVNDLLNLELSQRILDLEAARDGLNDAMTRWSGFIEIIMPDTSVYIEHTDKLADLDFAELMAGDLYPGSNLIVLVPLAVIDELDRLKDSSKNHVRWRATHALGVIDGLFQVTHHRVPVPSPKPKEWGHPVGMELVFDPPGHVRLPIEDDEIVDRAVSMAALTEHPVTLITFDTGQSLRARSAGLRVKKLRRPKAEQEEDPGPPSLRPTKRERQEAREASAGQAPEGTDAAVTQ